MLAYTATPFLSLLALLPTALALDDNAMRSRSVYQLVTDRFAQPSGTSTACNTSDRQYCGGTWSAIAQHLDYIQGMGFDTVWISPVVSNIQGTTELGEAYHGYWTLDPSQLNSNFGTADDLKNLASALHAKGMYLMVDIVINHVAATSSSTFAPSADYGPFSVQEDYHPFCWITDYTNQTNVEECWLGDESVALPDLNTGSDTVKSYWKNWITQLVGNYSIDAIRIDTVKHVDMAFWTDFVPSIGVFNQGEVLDPEPRYNADYQNTAKVNPFNYPVYYPLYRTFNSSTFSMDSLVEMVSEVKMNFSDPTLLGSFINNHDNPRFESYNQDAAQIMNAHAYPMVTDGIPYVYYGDEAGLTGGNDPDNREALWITAYKTDSTMYIFFTNLNAARAAAGAADSAFYTNQMTLTALSANNLLVAKPPLISVLSNTGSAGSSSNVTIPTASSKWSGSVQVIDAVSCQMFMTSSTGDLSMNLDAGKPRVLIEASKKGNVCSNTTSSTGGSTGGSRGGSSGTGGAGERVGSVAWTGLGLVVVGVWSMSHLL